ncbi:MAG: lysophospholipid acyltransferase family protein [Muribaculaceae bacterium]|nr:lysophospholipid acyltransferase family protein [Muribaculaceae bacterium]
MGKHTHNKTAIAINRALLSGIFRGLGALPWPILRGVSSFIAWLAHSVVRYRVGICRDNISSAFPEMPDQDVKKTVGEFYRFLADYFIETVKLGSMDSKEMRERMQFENIEEVNADLRAGLNVSIYLGHFCNWEWVSSMPLWLDLSTGAVPCQIYHPLSNVAADEVFGSIRSRFGATNLPMASSARTLMEMTSKGIPSITGYIADQTPPGRSLHHWIPFLNHDTAVFTGAEKISRKIHAAVYYLDMRRTERNRYVGRFVKITPDAAAEQENNLTAAYFSMLADSIRREPPLWLWTHRRWKHQRPTASS